MLTFFRVVVLFFFLSRFSAWVVNFPRKTKINFLVFSEEERDEEEDAKINHPFTLH